MSDNIKVKGSELVNAVHVATDEISNVHYPIYKLAYGEDGTATLMTSDGLPIQFATETVEIQREILQALKTLEKELKIMNIHLSMMTDNEITKAELD